jgi:hypothetical protein
LWTKNGGLNSALVADTMETAEHLDQSMLHPGDFRYRKIFRHLLGETLQQVTIASSRPREGIHHLGADQVLGRNHVVHFGDVDARKRLRPDGKEQDLSSLVSSRNAVHFLYEESLANGNADITAVLGEALTCGD